MKVGKGHGGGGFKKNVQERGKGASGKKIRERYGVGKKFPVLQRVKGKPQVLQIYEENKEGRMRVRVQSGKTKKRTSSQP